jgi:hypothetical protein
MPTQPPPDRAADPSGNTPPGAVAPPTVDTTPPASSADDRGTGPHAPAADSNSLPGPAGRLHLGAEIARGGMGAVLRGHDPVLQRDLAVKVLRAEFADNPDLVRRFVEEAQVGGQLQHPGIVPVHELGTLADGRPFIAMKLVKGRTLAELLAGRPDPAHDLPRFLGVFGQVCQTVAYAHSKCVVHRDLKPANVMVGAFGEVQVMDWGLAKVLGKEPAAGAPPPASAIHTLRSDQPAQQSQAGAVLGTCAYMAPEQARGEAVFDYQERERGRLLLEWLAKEPGRRDTALFDRPDWADRARELARCEAALRGARGEARRSLLRSYAAKLASRDVLFEDHLLERERRATDLLPRLPAARDLARRLPVGSVYVAPVVTREGVYLLCARRGKGAWLVYEPGHPKEVEDAAAAVRDEIESQIDRYHRGQPGAVPGWTVMGDQVRRDLFSA